MLKQNAATSTSPGDTLGTRCRSTFTKFGSLALSKNAEILMMPFNHNTMKTLRGVRSLIIRIETVDRHAHHRPRMLRHNRSGRSIGLQFIRNQSRHNINYRHPITRTDMLRQVIIEKC